MSEVKFKIGDTVRFLGGRTTAVVIMVEEDKIHCNNWSDDPENPNEEDWQRPDAFTVLTPLEKAML